MIATLLFVGTLVAFLAWLGRSATPRLERVPWWSWTLTDLVDNVVLGVRRFLQLSARHPLRSRRWPPLQR